MPVQPTLPDLRAQLDAAFDDAQLDAFCLDHFPEVYAQFGRGLRRDEKVTLLLNHCRNKSCREQLAHLLAASELPTASTSLNPTHLATYLAALREQCARLETRPYKQLSELRDAPARLTLLETYEPLRFDLHLGYAQPDTHPNRQFSEPRGASACLTQIKPPEAPRRLSRVTLPEVLTEPGHVVFLGKAGSGKTTVSRLATMILAVADLDLAVQYLGLISEPLPVPVLIALREFEYACNAIPTQITRDVPGLLRFVDAQFQRRHPGCVPQAFVSALIRAGHAWIFLDALDEVADFDHRIAVRQTIEDLARAFPENRLVVTARVAAYEHANTRLDADFNLAYVRDLNREQWVPLVERLYAGLEADSHFAAERAAKLVARIDTAPQLQEMVKTPLMVWTATLIHYADRELPEQRAELYQAYVDVLLGERLHEEEGAEAAQALRDTHWPVADRQLYLTYAAYKTHEGAAEELIRSAERRALALVDETTLKRQILAPLMAETMMLDVSTLAGRRKAESEAEEFIKLMAERSGLLHAQPEGYTFGDHLTLQEFLTAHYLVKNLHGQERLIFLETHAGKSWWREVLLLMAGMLLQESRQAQRFLLQELGALSGSSDSHAYGVAWAGRALLEIPPARVGWHAGARAELASRLVQVLWQNPPQTSVAARIEAGAVLGLLGDPRFSGPCNLPEFIPLPGSEFWMGSTDEEAAQIEMKTYRYWARRELPRHRVSVDGFAMAKVPTTNAMFARFVEANGYADMEWWRDTPKEFWRHPGQVKEWFGYVRTRPHFWDDERVNGGNQPVVGISWYEAVAYCRWLTATLNDGYCYRLPTEAEWEYAARGKEGRRFAWGDEWVTGRANTQELAVESTTPVGLFPDGATPEGFLDLTGNVLEWCSDWYDWTEYARRAGNVVWNPTGPDRGGSKVLRGGSFGYDASWARCACRDNIDPGIYGKYGFRVVRSSPR